MPIASMRMSSITPSSGHLTVGAGSGAFHETVFRLVKLGGSA
jgi:hypothetical protein